MVLKEHNARAGSEARAPSLLRGLPSKLLGYFKVLYMSLVILETVKMF
jgi:hypothetical protein